MNVNNVTCGVSVIQAIECGYHKIPIAQHGYVMDLSHVAAWNDALLLELTVEHDDARLVAATPELLVDDAQGFR